MQIFANVHINAVGEHNSKSGIVVKLVSTITMTANSDMRDFTTQTVTKAHVLVFPDMKVITYDQDDLTETGILDNTVKAPRTTRSSAKSA